MLFIYGTLQDADVLGAVLGRPVVVAGLRRAVAPGFRAVVHPGRVYPALVASGDEAAPGLLLDNLSHLDLAVLDAFEGEEYRRRPISVLVDGVGHPADAYLPLAAISANAPVWSLADWTSVHKPAVLGRETETATALRQRLAAQVPDDRHDFVQQ
ncbi:gamma-glutamylcyclotransferase family protein [Devosia ginsengisoli]|uniref:Putative gamma-glutamylcyclotransferase n=1 Tax=Devosia ginsengisoli TaxID=400770 RepID=A0A5B8LVA0_9HYPH|nr:gamma-glutamylcyclotransferase family protein [Devosia ginsengisoli]QDZ12016.1 gamma-glutamylcyclotransferase [Devosia ginsengisoli]